ncbi:glycine zipper 2TM domain-containing protein [Sulfitobacter sp. F26204]|uniref:glycine zipper 2TM domain-containing protein n=1 Tax=Sulfitobacter sp. F26204 TaxID=2996014 RepID=UPI00225E25F7|nr:glycine zipper 2TM domain-containing protein [Sulfitobacter sp. F26204]MCX7558507.1 glycine zipper 2TM domain-containing protein [Sulfitobacter sp. F26204]
MKKLLLSLPLMAALAACATDQQTSTLAGAAVGAAAGAAVSGDDDKVVGALVGGAAGAAAGSYIGRTQSGSCVYQRPNGSRYTAACP